MATAMVDTPVPAIPAPAPPAASPAPTGQGSAPVPSQASALWVVGNRLREYATSTLEQRKPWAEVFDRSSFSKPANMQEAAGRLRKNAGYFRVNYIIVAGLTIAASFVSHPSSLLVLAGLLASWVYMFALRQGPLVMFDREFSEREKFVGMVAASLLVVFVFSSVGAVVFSAMMMAAGIVGLHGATRVPDDLFLDDADANSSLLSIFTGGAAPSSGANAV